MILRKKEAGGDQTGIYPIQPDHYRAPEVILGCGWDSKADIWNFGVMVTSPPILSLSEYHEQGLSLKSDVEYY